MHPTPAATKASWKTIPHPERREPLGLDAHYYDDEGAALRQGFIPRGMEDKWFIYFDAGWLYFHRSWTGACIYGVRLDEGVAGIRVLDSWVSREKEQYTSTDLDYDRQLLKFIIDAILLKKPANCPIPSAIPENLTKAYQHHTTGTARPMHRVSSKSPLHRFLAKLNPFKHRPDA